MKPEIKDDNPIIKELGIDIWNKIPEKYRPRFLDDSRTGHPDVTLNPGIARIRIVFKRVDYKQAIKEIEHVVSQYGKTLFNMTYAPCHPEIPVVLEIMIINQHVPNHQQIPYEKMQLVAVLVARVYSSFDNKGVKK